MLKTLILIPSYNEKKSLTKILKKIKNNNKILVMDDCSVDGTSLLFRNEKNIKIFSNNKNYGYEKNLLKGFKKSFKFNFDYILTFDADGEHDFKDISKIKEFLIHNRPDMLVGSRKYMNRSSERIVSFFFKLFLNVHDPLSGLKAYKVSKLKKILSMTSSKFFLVDIIKLFKNNNFIVQNIKINSKIKKKRISRTGSGVSTTLKILKCLKLLF